LIEFCKKAESEIGRIPRQRWKEREIDIDILLYGTKLIKSEFLTIPHPEMHKRKFVLIPAAEIAGKMFHPTFGKTIDELIAVCSDNSLVRIYDAMI